MKQVENNGPIERGGKDPIIKDRSKRGKKNRPIERNEKDPIIKDKTKRGKTKCNSHYPFLQKQPSEVFFKKRGFKKFQKIHRKTPVPEPQACNFIKKRDWHRCFLVNLRNF